MTLLDTHIVVHLALGLPLRFREEYDAARLFVSPITAAELACLQRTNRLLLHQPADTWFDALVERAGLQVLPLSPGLFARAMLLEWDHRDPADRVLVQSVRENPGMELHTRNATILSFARANRLAVRDCRL